MTESLGGKVHLTKVIKYVFLNYFAAVHKELPNIAVIFLALIFWSVLV